MAGEKNYQPTARKLKKAREDGDVLKSRDLTSSIGLIAVLAFYYFFAQQGISELVSFFSEILSFPRDIDSEIMLLLLTKAILVVFLLIGPVLLLVCLISAVVEGIQVGFYWNFKNLAWKWSRLSFFKGIGRLFGFEAEGKWTAKLFFDSLKGFFLVLIGFAVTAAISAKVLLRLAVAGFSELREVGNLALVLILWVVSALVVLWLIVGVVDLFVQRQRRLNRLKMDREELIREFRETEGSPELRGLRKQLHQEMALHGLIEGVRKARVVVVKK